MLSLIPESGLSNDCRSIGLRMQPTTSFRYARACVFGFATTGAELVLSRRSPEPVRGQHSPQT